MTKSFDELGEFTPEPEYNELQSTNSLGEPFDDTEYSPIQAIDIEPNWTSSKAGALLARFCMFSDVMPINLGVYSVLEITTHKNFLSLASLAVSTMVTKSSGAVSSVDLLHTESLEQASREFADQHPLLNSFNLHKKDFNKDLADNDSFMSSVRKARQPLIDVAVSTIVGTSVMSGMRQVQSPEISRSSGRRRGILMAAISTLITTAGIKYLGEHWTDPTTYEPIGGVVAAGGLLAAWRIFKKPEPKAGLESDLE